MTQQEKEEIRQIIREELKNWEKQSLPYATPQYCQHEWVINPNPAGTGSFCQCKKCGSMVSELTMPPFAIVDIVTGQ